jgi:hypothetical protein
MHEKEMADLLKKMGVVDADALAKVIVEAAQEQNQQRKVWSTKFDDGHNSYEWAGYLMKTFGSGLAGFPTNPDLFRTKTIHSIAMLFAAVMSVDRNPQNVIKK